MEKMGNKARLVIPMHHGADAVGTIAEAGRFSKLTEIPVMIMNPQGYKYT